MPRPTWTPEMDRALRDALANGLTFALASGRIFLVTGRTVTKQAVAARADRLELMGVSGIGPDMAAVRASDALLARLRKHHKAPPAEVPMSPGGPRLDWRRLVPAAGVCGSPAALCAEA